MTKSINDIDIIGIDHGFKNMKTVHHLFPTALSRLSAKPDEHDGILEYNGNVYSIYGDTISAIDNHDKSTSTEFYILTLVSLAKELKARGKRNSKVRIATGLPQKWYLTQKEEFKKSLFRTKEIHFHFEGEHYHVSLESVNVYTQGFAAYMTKMNEINIASDYFVIVDIGGETFDVIPVLKNKIVQSECKIDTKATIWLMNEIAEKIEAETYESINQNTLLNLLLKSGKDVPAGNKYEEIIKKETIEYSKYVFKRLKEFKINLDLTPIVFVGGGGSLIEKYGTYNKDITYFISDLRANAKGYELIESVMARKR